jgi:pimeloyl-ACP methyl ester carboxylesterase
VTGAADLWEHGPMVATHRVPSTRGVTVALHDLGGDGPPVLMCHPTGFHGMTWAPLAAELAPVARCWAPDLRGHGDATPPADGDYDWRGMGDDVLAVVDEIGRLTGAAGLRGVGHSMGGAALVLAELERPGTFSSLWLYEPILIPSLEGTPRTDARGGPNPMAERARKRRRSFPDRDAAYENYAAKPPMSTMTPAALRAYVDHGFRDTPGGEVELKCTPEVEADVFGSSGSPRAFDRLDEVACPVAIVVGGDGGMPAQLAPLVARALPHGRLEPHPELTHFGPMEDPPAMAASVRAALGLGAP